MANILLLDEDDVAGRALQGILSRGNHHCFHAKTVEEAWRILREGILLDVVFVELKLPGNGGLNFLQRVREDWFWKILPVVVYTYETESKFVRKALGLKVQNYLVKPYHDDLVYAEIAKATLNPWRNLHFEEPRSFCAQLGLSLESLMKMRREVMVAFDEAARTFPTWVDQHDPEEVNTRLTGLASDAETAGIWAGVDYLRELQAQAEAGNWDVFKNSAEYLDYASRLIFCQLNPSYVPEGLQTESERDHAKEAEERARWERYDPDASGPLLDVATIEKQLAGLRGCPVVDSAAAAFQMAADGRAASMSQVMDLVMSDPGLCAQVIIAANRNEHDDMTAIEDGRAAASLLGELKLNALSKSLPTMPEKNMQMPPFTWANFWMYAVGVGKVAQFICNYLEFAYLTGNAYTAGMLHDIGKLLLVKLHPHGFQAIVRYARDRKLPMQVAEKKFLGCTSREMAVRFAEKHALPRLYTNVIRWVESPTEATEHTDLVAMVSLARHVCLQNHVGYCGDMPPSACPPLSTTPAWSMLQPRLFPSFELKKFEAQAQAYCLALRQELSGQRSDRPQMTTSPVKRTPAMA